MSTREITNQVDISEELLDNEVPREIEESRKLAMEATIVRILKSRKAVNHNELLAEVSKQLSARFKCTPSMIKRCIESLIERDYLVRDNVDRSIYNYVA